MEEPVRDDAAHLKSLRLAADLDHAQLALMVNLSAAQVRQLEEDGESLFYSPQIKAQSLRRVIRTLENASQEPQTVASIEPPAPRSSASVIDDIIRLSEKNLKSQVVHSDVRRPGGSWPKLLGTWGLAALLLVLGLWQYNRHNSQALYEEWVEPITGKVLPAPPTATTEEVPAVVPEVIAAAPAPTQAVVVPPSAKETTAKETTSSETAATKTTTVCVDDGKNKRNLVTLTPGAGRSIHGSPPWTIATSEFKSVQVYFQGAKVWVPPEAGSRIYLKELPISP